MKAEPQKVAPKKIPAFRIEIHDKEKALWWPIEFAHTETQRDAKLDRRKKEFGDELARAVPNGSSCDEPLVLEFIDVAALNLLRNVLDFIKSQKLSADFSKIYGVDLEQIPTPDEMLVKFREAIAGEVPPDFPAEFSRDPVSTETPVAVPIVATATGGAQLVKADAIAGVTPLPFEEGDTLEDIHTHAKIRVTKIHEADGSGRAFDWENLDPASSEKTGTCPINAVGNFAVEEAETPKRKKR